MRLRPKTALVSLENVYLVVALSGGLLMAALNPPFTGVPDEQSHFWKAWAVSLGDVTCRKGNTIPTSVHKVGIAFPVIVDVPGVGERVLFSKTLKKFLDDDDLTEQTEKVYAVCGAPPLGYLPQAAAVRIGASLHWSVLAGFYLARVFNLVASVLLVYWAIRIIPFGKIVLLVVALLPMTLQQFASLSYDALHIATSFLFIGYVLKLASLPHAPVRPRDAAALLVLGLFVCNAKFGYLGLTFLVFLLPLEKFRGRKQYWLFTLGFVAVNVLIFYAVYKYFQAHLAPGGGPGLPQVSTGKQLKHVIDAPLRFLVVLLDTLYSRFNFYFESLLFRPGWLQVSLPPPWYLLMAAGMAFFIRNEEETVALSAGQRFIVLGVFLLNVFAVFFSMYLAWTPVDAGLIEGVQGRYLLNVLPLLILFFYKAGFSFRAAWAQKNRHALLLAFYTAMIGWALLTLYRIFYDKEPGVSLFLRLYGKLFGR